jgi:hypothetical protein
MRPLDHFFSKLDSLGNSPQDLSRLEQDFSRLIAPVLGAAAAADLCNRNRDGPAASQKLGAMAAFFLGEYDEASMPLLDRDDWHTIREVLEDVAGEMDINTLTALMGELLSRGILE